MNIYLIGYRGTGKSSLAREIGGRTGWDWVDSDQLIEQQAGMTIAEIFAQGGEAAFRDAESSVIHTIAGSDRTIVSLGGGAILRERNRDSIRDGKTIWLEASIDTIERRIGDDAATAARRPKLTSAGGREEIEALLEQRLPLYEQAADYRLATDDRSIEDLADEVIAWVTSVSKGEFA